MKLKQLTKKIALSALILAGFMISTTINYANKTCSWTGVWNTNLGPLELVQKGEKVTGNFKDRYFEVKGTSYGNYLSGNWFYSEVCEPEYYPLKLIMSDDCLSFDGDRSENLNPDGIDWEFYSLHGNKTTQRLNPRPPSSPPPNQNPNNGNQFVYIKDAAISFTMDNNWSYDRDKDQSLMFTSKKDPDTFVIFIINEVFDYSNNYERQLFLDAQMQEAIKMAKGKVTSSIKNINGKYITIIEVPQEDSINTNIYLPDTGNKFFMMTATYVDPEQIRTANPLLNSIMAGMVNSK